MDLVILLIAISINLLLGLFVLLRNYRSATNILFFLLNVDIALWSLANYISLQVTDLGSVLFWMRLVMFLAVPQAVLFYLLIHTLPNVQIRLQRKYFFGLIILTLCAMVLTLTPLVFSKVEVANGSINPVPGPGIILFVLTAVGSVIAGVTTLIHKYLKAEGLNKLQLKYILFGVVLMFFLIITFNFILVVLFNNLFFISLSPLYTYPFSLVVAYTIIRHRFFDIRLIVARSVAYALVIFFIGAVYASTLFNLATIFSSNFNYQANILVSSILAILFALSFQPLKKFFEKITDKVFYKDHYEANDLLWSLSRVMASTLELSDMSKKILDELLTSMKISYGMIVLIRNASIIWVGTSGKVSGHPLRGKDTYELIRESHMRKITKEHILIFEELSESKLKQSMRNQNVTVVIPLVVQKELIGGILLGEKASGEIYSSDDIDLLKIIAPEIAVAVRNSLSYDEIKRFNVTLEEEVKRATTRLTRANKRLKELDALKDEFVSVASHELRTPMTAIKSYLWMALNKGGPVKDPMKKYLEISYSSTERLINLVNDMLVVSRIERNKIELKPEIFDVFELLQMVYDELRISADEKKIAFELLKEDKTHSKIRGDKLKIREVFQNIIGNALKFTPSNGSITTTLHSTQHHLLIAIKDTGPGIPEQEMSKLFQKFSKIEYSYANHVNQPGTGLGLYISKQIVSLHGGNIEVESKVNVGSTFTVVLPLSLSKE